MKNFFTIIWQIITFPFRVIGNIFKALFGSNKSENKRTSFERARPKAVKMQDRESPSLERIYLAESSADPRVSEAAKHALGYVDKIRAVNAKIKDKELSGVVQKVQDVTVNIFDYVAQNPDSAVHTRRFTSYYLPTMLKLLEKYVEFDNKAVQSESVAHTKTKIKEMVSTIYEAFYKMHEDLYSDASIDILSEMAAMQTILVTEGLVADSQNDLSSVMNDDFGKNLDSEP